MYDEVESIRLAFADAVVVNRGAQVFARAGIERNQAQRRAGGGECDGRRVRAVDDAYDKRPTPAVLEELFESVRQRRGLPQATKHLLEFREARDRNRLIHGSLERAPHEGGYSSRHTLDRAVRCSALFCEFYAGNAAVGHFEPLGIPTH